MRWVPVYDDPGMIKVAVDRGLVRLDDGRVVRLIGWPGPGRPRNRRGRYARLQNANGTEFTLHVSRVAEVDADERN